MTLLPKIDGIVFTAGVGENSDYVRLKCTEELEHLGIVIDKEKNAKREKVLRIISADNSKIPIYVIPTNEELEIAT